MLFDKEDTMKKTCPCGSGETYDYCCGPYHEGRALPETALQLMRSRYSAFVLKLADYLLDTAHPDKRRPQLKNEITAGFEDIEWLGLEIISKSLGEKSDKIGKVEFKAYYLSGGREYVQHELSRFKKHSGRWYYLDGILQPQQ